VTPPQRIGFDARYISDRYHGIGRYAFHLLEAMTAAAPERTFVIFTGRDEDCRFNWDVLRARPNVELHPGPWPLYRPQTQLAWPFLLRRHQIELFHTPSFEAPLLAPCPVIVTVHDLIFDRYPACMPHRWARPYYRLMMTLSTRRARQIVTVSRATALELMHFYRTPPHKIAVIWPGIEPAFAPVADLNRRAAVRQRYGLTAPFALVVGARRPHKNLTRLVEAFASLTPSLPHHLVFAGQADPRFADEARQGVNRHTAALSSRVHFLDWVPEADLPVLYSLADVVVMPSLVEGFGLPALEAMACGTPVIAANASSLPEVVGNAGLLADPHSVRALSESLRAVLTDGVLRRNLAAAGHRRAARFRWTKAARRALRLYETPPHPQNATQTLWEAGDWETGDWGGGRLEIGRLGKQEFEV